MRSGMARVRKITQFYLPPTRLSTNGIGNILPLLRKRRMAPPERGSAHPITAHYSLIDLKRMKGWVGLVGPAIPKRKQMVKKNSDESPHRRGRVIHGRQCNMTLTNLKHCSRLPQSRCRYWFLCCIKHRSTHSKYVLAKVNSRSRSLHAIARLSVVCLSVVCIVRAPYSAGWNFRQCFFRHLVPWPSVTFP